MVGADTRIYVVDEIEPKPGKGEEFLKFYRETYVPLAEARGMRLEHSLVNPPVWLTGDQQNTLLIVWSVANVEAYWAMQGKIRWDPSIADWWSDAERMMTSRKRLVLGDAANIASLTNV